jgi:hypothetical protein
MIDWVILGQMNPGLAIFLGIMFVIITAIAYWWLGGSNDKKDS